MEEEYIMGIIKNNKVNIFLVSITMIAILLCCNSQLLAAQDGSTKTISGDYVLIVNESLKDAQQSGTISFDDTNAFRPSKTVQSLFKNMNLYQKKPITGAADFGIKKTQAVKTSYKLGDTKQLKNSIFTLRGIGKHCYIWMDDTTYSLYTGTTLSAAVADIINVYDTYSYPVLQKLGADYLMNYADGSGKLSIFLEKKIDVSFWIFRPG